MALFVTKEGKRKSTMALTVFFVALLYCVVFGIAYALLVEPLHQALPFENGTLETIVHCTLIACVGTAVCCLLFFLPDKRIVPYSFAGLMVVPVMFGLASLLLDAQTRSTMLNVIMMYSIGPVVVGNIVSWTLYFRFRRKKQSRQGAGLEL